MLTNNKPMSLSSRLSKAGMILQRVRTVTQPRWKWYTSIEFLPVRNFYKASEGELRWLLKGIDYENLPEISIDLEPAWQNIWQEFVDISNDRDYQIYFESLRKLYRIQNQYEILKSQLFTLYFRYNPSYAEDLKAENITLDLSTREKYLNSLDEAVHRVEQYKTRITLLEKEIQAKTPKTKMEFEDLVFMVERYQGFPVNIDTLSIKRFVLMLNKIREDGKRKN